MAALGDEKETNFEATDEGSFPVEGVVSIDPGHDNTQKTNHVSISYEEYQELLELKRKNESQTQTKRQEFIMTKEEKRKYQEFLQTKEECLKQRNNNIDEKKDEISSQLDKLNTTINAIKNEYKNHYEILMNKFANTELKCNNEWKKVNNGDNINCISLMNNNINEYNSYQTKVNENNRKLTSYLSDINGKLTRILNDTSTKQLPNQNVCIAMTNIQKYMHFYIILCYTNYIICYIL